jgi:Flp pilus assembly protein TadD
LSRRIPDFLCYALNVGGVERTALLEVRTPPEDGPSDWVTFREQPDPDEALEMVPGQSPVAVVTGVLEAAGDDLEVSLTVVRARGLGASGLDGASTLRQKISAADPADACLRLARNLARRLSIEVPVVPWFRVGTRNSKAFLRYLDGLDGAAAFDAGLREGVDIAELVRPFLDALALDPSFALAIRQAHLLLGRGIEDGLLPRDRCLPLLDRFLALQPRDAVAVLSVGEQLAALEEPARAEKWLRLACSLPNPPSRAFEGLGILLANRGETIEARELWLKGLELDGHPDFFAHLARLAFSEERETEGWDKVVRGLRRISEQCLRPSEWGDESERSGVLLQYLPEHLAEMEAPPDVVEALLDLCGQLQFPEHRVDLGLSLIECAHPAEGLRELQAGLPHVEDRDKRDTGARRLLELTLPDFSRRFQRAVQLATDGEKPEGALADLEAFHEAGPLFWPASFFHGMVLRRLHRFAEARTRLERAQRLRPDQPEILNELAVVLDELGRTEDALGTIDHAIAIDDAEAVYHSNRAVFLNRLGRKADARAALATARRIAPGDTNLRNLQKELDQE